MNKILVPTDTSDFGCMAIAHAQSLAKALDAQLIITGIQVDPVPVTIDGFAYTPPTSTHDFAEQLVQFRNTLEEKAPDTPIIVEQAAGRPVWQAILDVAKSSQVQMIVMTTHGRQGLSHVFLGSVAEDVIKHANVPVMLIHGEQEVKQWN